MYLIIQLWLQWTKSLRRMFHFLSRHFPVYMDPRCIVLDTIQKCLETGDSIKRCYIQLTYYGISTHDSSTMKMFSNEFELDSRQEAKDFKMQYPMPLMSNTEPIPCIVVIGMAYCYYFRTNQ